MRTLLKFFGFIAAASFAAFANAETFAVSGGSIEAVPVGENVTIKVTGISAATLVHFRGQGEKGGFIHTAPMKEGVGVLENVAKNGGRFQIKDASGKWLLITPVGNPYKMVGVTQECAKSKAGCALELALGKS